MILVHGPADDFLVFYLFLLVSLIHGLFTRSHVDPVLGFLRIDTSQSSMKLGFSSSCGGPVLPMRCVFLPGESPFSTDLRQFVITDVRTSAPHLPIDCNTIPTLSPPYRCSHTAWIELAIFVFLTLMAQIFLTVRSVNMFRICLVMDVSGTDGHALRIYALTLRNKVIAAFFCGVTIPQLVIGIYLVTLGAINPGGFAPLKALHPSEVLITEFSPYHAHPYTLGSGI